METPRRSHRTGGGRVEIGLGYACTNRCLFCSEHYNRSDGRTRSLGHELDTAAVVRRCAELRRSGAEHLTLLGGEPTLRPDFFAIADAARAMGFHAVATTTNGRRFAQLDFAAAWRQRPWLRPTISLHGADASVHDLITGAQGAFAEAQEGLRNLAAQGIPYDVTGVLCRQNIETLGALAEFHIGLKPGRIQWVLARPVGLAYERFDTVVPRVAEAGRRLAPVLPELRRARMPFTLAHLPLCHMPGCEDLADEAHWSDDIRGPLREVTKFRAVDDQGATERPYLVTWDHHKMKPAACRSCRFFAVCAGVFSEYLRRVGGDELVPVPGEPVLTFTALRALHRQGPAQPPAMEP